MTEFRIPRLSLRDVDTIAVLLMTGKPFNAGNLYGRKGWPRSFGALPERVKEALQERGPAIDYVIYSYETPIAWHTGQSTSWEWNKYKHGLEQVTYPGFWTVPEIKYSRSTSRHQNVIQEAFPFETKLHDVPDEWKD